MRQPNPATAVVSTGDGLTETLLNGLHDLIWVVEPSQKIIYANAHAKDFLGLQDNEDWRQRWMEAIHPEDQERIAEAWGAARASGAVYEMERRMRHVSGAYRWMLVRALPIRASDGSISHWLCLATDIHDQRNRLQRIEVLQNVTAALSGAMTIDAAIDTILALGLPAVAADAGFVTLFDETDGHLKTVKAVGYPEHLTQHFASYLPFSGIPVGKCFLTGEPIYLEGAEDIERNFPGTRDIQAATGDETLAVLPLKIDGTTMGVIAFSYRRTALLDEEIRNFMLALSRQCSQALERARLFERERAARHLAERERERFYTILERLPVSIGIVKGPEHRFEFANQSYRELVLNGRTDYVGLTMREALSHFPSDRLVGMAEHAYRTGEPMGQNEQELARVQPDGTTKIEYWSGLKLPWYGTDGKIEGVLFYCFEVTEQVLARRKIEKSEERLRLAIEASQTGLWEWNSNSPKAFVTGNYENIYGLEKLPDDWSIESIHKLIHPEDLPRALELLGSILNDRTVERFEGEWRIIRPDGKTRWIQDKGRVARDSEGAPVRVYGSVSDITALKLVQEELKAARDLAEAASRAKTAFVANMSHELRTPLSAIVGFGEFLGREDLAAEKRQGYVEGIRRNGQALLKLIEDILDLSRVETGHVAVDLQPISPRSLIMDVVTMFMDQAGQKNVAIDIDIKGDPPARFDSDPIRLRQIIINILGNAVKFTERGKIDIKVSYVDKGDGSASRLEIRIVDTGIGLTPDQAKRLFQPFSQADESTRRKFGGTGLGLFISRKLAQALGGDVLLESTEHGKGSVFLIEIADMKHECSQVGRATFDQAKTKMQSAAALKGLNMLVVEDTADIRELLQAHFEEAGADVELACDGEEAILLAEKSRFDVVLMDLHMPKMDGYAATEELRKRGLSIPIVAVTARAQPEDRVRCFESGFDAYCTKPIRLSELEAVIRRLLRK